MLDIIKEFFTADFLFTVIRVGTPLLYASMSAYVASLAGIPNIAVEGIMIFGALFGVYFSAIFASSWLGLGGVILIGVISAFVLAFFTMKLKASPIMIGIALNLFASNFSLYLLKLWTGTKGTSASLPSKVLPTIEIPVIKDIPIIGEIISGHYFLTYVCIILVILLAILVYKTPFGLRMKACGLDEHAAESVGIKVNKVRLIAIILSGIFAALGGAYLSMGYMSIFSNNMTSSRGWTGIAAQAVGGMNLLIVVITTIIFSVAQGIVDALAIYDLPSELVNIIPYVIVLFTMVFLSIKESNKKKNN